MPSQIHIRSSLPGRRMNPLNDAFSNANQPRRRTSPARRASTYRPSYNARDLSPTSARGRSPTPREPRSHRDQGRHYSPRHRSPAVRPSPSPSRASSAGFYRRNSSFSPPLESPSRRLTSPPRHLRRSSPYPLGRRHRERSINSRSSSSRQHSDHYIGSHGRSRSSSRSLVSTHDIWRPDEDLDSRSYRPNRRSFSPFPRKRRSKPRRRRHPRLSSSPRRTLSADLRREPQRSPRGATGRGDLEDSVMSYRGDHYPRSRGNSRGRSYGGSPGYPPAHMHHGPPPPQPWDVPYQGQSYYGQGYGGAPHGPPPPPPPHSRGYMHHGPPPPQSYHARPPPPASPGAHGYGYGCRSFVSL